MSSLGDSFKNPNAYRGAADDLLRRALDVSPQELADMVTAIGKRAPAEARAIVSTMLAKTVPQPVTTTVVKPKPQPQRPVSTNVLNPKPQPPVSPTGLEPESKPQRSPYGHRYSWRG